MQAVARDVWDTKYRLRTKDGRVLDETLDGTYQRVARTVADLERAQAEAEAAAADETDMSELVGSGEDTGPTDDDMSLLLVLTHA